MAVLLIRLLVVSLVSKALNLRVGTLKTAPINIPLIRENHGFFGRASCYRPSVSYLLSPYDMRPSDEDFLSLQRSFCQSASSSRALGILQCALCPLLTFDHGKIHQILSLSSPALIFLRSAGLHSFFLVMRVAHSN